MEMIFDASDRDAVERVAVAMAGFRQAPISRSVTDVATATVLAFTSPVGRASRLDRLTRDVLDAPASLIIGAKRYGVA